MNKPQLPDYHADTIELVDGTVVVTMKKTDIPEYALTKLRQKK